MLTPEQTKALDTYTDETERAFAQKAAERLWREEPKSACHELGLPRSRFRREFVAVLRAFKPETKGTNS